MICRSFSDGCVKFLERQAKSLSLQCQIVYVKPHKPIVIISWIGKEPQIQSILLNSHMDVVPVFEVRKNNGINIDTNTIPILFVKYLSDLEEITVII